MILYLLSDAGQMATWPKVKACLNEGDALYFSHGFSIVYASQTGVVAPDYVDVIMVAPKGPGHLVRRLYTEGKGLPSLIAVFQNRSKRAKQLALAWASASGLLRVARTILFTTETPRAQRTAAETLRVLCASVVQSDQYAAWTPLIFFFDSQGIMARRRWPVRSIRCFSPALSRRW